MAPYCAIPLFGALPPVESMRSGGAIPPPPPRKGYLSDTGSIPYENEIRYCAICRGGISHWAAKVGNGDIPFKQESISRMHPSRDVIFFGQNLAKKRQKLFLYMTSGSLENRRFWHHVM